MNLVYPVKALLAFAIVLAGALPVGAQVTAGSKAEQTESDAYTRYELLASGSARFRIIYDVSATTAGAVWYFNAIRRGSSASDEAVYDRMTGKPLEFDIVTGAVARAGGVAGADTAGSYIRVRLPRPVPRDGEMRLRIDKTYRDTTSYFEHAGLLVFSRPLGIKRNAVVLPSGYELVGCNYPSQVFAEPDGRIAVSFINPGPSEVPFIVKARRLP